MGRPLSKQQLFGANSKNNIKVQFNNGTASVDGYIIRQTGSKRFVCSDINGVQKTCYLKAKASASLAAGEMSITVLDDTNTAYQITKIARHRVSYSNTSAPWTFTADLTDGYVQMEEAGIKVIATPVGDRYVLEKMLAENLTLGGEQSGHIINRQFANTGDGILTALQILQEMARSKKSISELASVMKRFPQVLINVKDVAKENLANSMAIADGVKKAESELGTSGRVLLRASGTEKLVRVMVEASSDNLALKIAEELATLVKAELG